jgi:hypothetical protein
MFVSKVPLDAIISRKSPFAITDWAGDPSSLVDLLQMSFELLFGPKCLIAFPALAGFIVVLEMCC